MAKRKRVSSLSPYIVFIAVFVIVLPLVIFQIVHFQSNTTEVVQRTQALGQIAWPMFDVDSQKTGINNNESFITKSTVTTLQRLWQVSLPTSDGSPVYLSGVITAQGMKNIIYATTKEGSLIAFDEANGSVVWRKDTQGGAGINTSSPAIDPNLQFIYSYGKDGMVHKYNVANGVEDTTNGWPFVATLIPGVEKGSSALTIGNGYLYVSISAYVGDSGPYVGHIAAKNLTSGVTSVFNVLCTTTKQLLNGSCGSRQAGVWGRPGAVVDPTTGNVFISSGNGPYNPPNDLGDSVIELNANLSQIVDTYTTQNYQTLDNADEDLGSTMPAMIPTQQGGNPPNIAVQGGKDNQLRVLNRQNLSGQSAPYHVGGELQSLPVDCNIFSHPLSWVDASSVTWVFVTDMCDNLYAYNVINSRLQRVYVKNNIGSSSPVLANGMLFIQTNGGVKAVDVVTGTILWTGQVGSMHWQSPIVINGHVFVLTNDGMLTAFGVSNMPTGTQANPPAMNLTLPVNQNINATLTPVLKPTFTPFPTPTLKPTLTPTPPYLTPTYYILQLGPNSKR